MFISYAQNFEDVMLWRALKHIKKGFYIDVGANDPVIDSVTKAFYDYGWAGINIEPISSHFADLEKTRLRDINLRCAVGEKEGETFIWESEVRGWATIEKSVIQNSIGNGITGIYHRVPLRTLEDICEEYATGEIHFLKIDVEGFENSVLAGANFNKFRPWIIVIEATSPNSTIEIFEEWEHLLITAKYKFAYADGLNRFYVAEEQKKLISNFKFPPNVFDNFKIARVKELEELLDNAKKQIQIGEIKSNELKSVYESNSWKITKPIRTFFKILFWLVTVIKNITLFFIFKLLRIINKFPYIEKSILTLITKLGIYEQIRIIYYKRKKLNSDTFYEEKNNRFSYLTPRSFMIYYELKAAFAKTKKDNI